MHEMPVALAIPDSQASDLPRVVRPLQQRLSLLLAAVHVTWLAVFAKLLQMSSKRSPPLDLPLIILAPASQVVPAIPLKPASRIFVVDPALLSPIPQGLGRVHLEVIQGSVMSLRTELGSLEPRVWKLLLTIGHVLAAEHAKLQHLPGSELRPKSRMKISPRRLRQFIRVIPLHQVVDSDKPN